ncbi:MFS transporter [Stappia sp. F7233]|uniref:MFS transporter n=1 Tax=Stappia albiluteola TaxID=2758565 RepID=A0A839AF10_9HYPH|nr:MFS transporter [Stappia albiluteola]MBA5777725.1 MFS transporter [Stappia albiluteola]
MGLNFRIAAIFAAFFFGTGLFLPFFPLVLAQNGFTSAEIGTLLAVPILVRLVANPVMSGISDRRNAARQSLVLFSAAAFVFFALLIRPAGFWPTFALLALVAVFWSPIVPLSDALALNEVRKGKADYGRLRLWGSIGFVVANLIGGVLLQYFHASYLIGGILVGLAAIFALALTMPKPEVEEDGAADGNGRGGKILKAPVFLAFLLAFGLIQASHAGYYAFGSLYWKTEGIPESAVGVLWTLGVVTEVALFYQAGKLRGRIGPFGFLVAGAVAAILRWMLFPEVTALWAIVVLQGLHGLTFGATHLGAVALIAAVVPRRWAGTGQAMASTAVGALTAVSTAIGGRLYEADPAFVFFLMAGLSALGLLVLLVLRRRLSALMA